MKQIEILKEQVTNFRQRCGEMQRNFSKLTREVLQEATIEELEALSGEVSYAEDALANLVFRAANCNYAAMLELDLKCMGVAPAPRRSRG